MEDSPVVYTSLSISSNPDGITCPLSAFQCGWVSQPDGRGTIDIIWSCGCALFICLWVMLHLNLPAENNGYWCIFCRKARWLLLGLITPKILLLSACGQWASAQRSVQDMKTLGHNQWTMTHVFNADSGGFVLKPLDRFAFPITAKQLHYLIVEGHLKYPAISERGICDKSKADKFTKTVAALQLVWLVLQCMARLIQNLPITPLALSTIAIILCTASTYFFWLHKPLDVDLPTVLDIDASVADILHRAGDAAKDPFRDTPFDFVKPHIYSLNLFRGESKLFSWLTSTQRQPLEPYSKRSKSTIQYFPAAFPPCIRRNYILHYPFLRLEF